MIPHLRLWQRVLAQKRGEEDMIYAALPPTITWERTQTLGRGDDCCDFRWRRAVTSR